MNRQQKETLKELIFLFCLLLFIFFVPRLFIKSYDEWQFEQDRIRAEKREMWLEAQTKQSSSTE